MENNEENKKIKVNNLLTLHNYVFFMQRKVDKFLSPEFIDQHDATLYSSLHNFVKKVIVQLGNQSFKMGECPIDINAMLQINWQMANALPTQKDFFHFMKYCAKLKSFINQLETQVWQLHANFAYTEVKNGK